MITNWQLPAHGHYLLIANPYWMKIIYQTRFVINLWARLWVSKQKVQYWSSHFRQQIENKKRQADKNLILEDYLLWKWVNHVCVYVNILYIHYIPQRKAMHYKYILKCLRNSKPILKFKCIYNTLKIMPYTDVFYNNVMNYRIYIRKYISQWFWNTFSIKFFSSTCVLNL